MLITVEFKLYPTTAQAETLTAWLRSCCWIYNRAIEQKKKSYARRGKSASLRNFCHRLSRRLVDNHPVIAIEKLKIKGLARGHCRKSVMDAGWNILFTQLASKAESAGRKVIEVDARRTSQTCPACGAVKPKSLSERTHICPCGLTIDRDEAAALVILSRSAGPSGGTKSPSEDLASASPAMAL